MPHTTVNGLQLYYEQNGNEGPPVVMVHGSWGDHHNWDMVVPALAEQYRVFTYDRRGHSQSERPEGQGYVSQDVDDLADLIKALDLTPAHIIGSSFGAIITLRLAGTRPELFRSLTAHEPPATPLIAGDNRFEASMEYFSRHIGVVRQHLEAGEQEAGAQYFAEHFIAGPGGWERMGPGGRETFVTNAPTYLDEMRDADSLSIDLESLSRFDKPALLTLGTTSAPFFAPVIEKIVAAMPNATLQFYEGAGHVPHLSHPVEYTTTVTNFLARVDA